MAPEMLLKWQCSPSTDVWSFGVTLFELMFKRHPFEEVMAIEHLGQTEVGQLINDALPTIRGEIGAFLKQAEGPSQVLGSALLAILNKDPTSRPTTSELYFYFKGHHSLEQESTCSEESENP